MNEIVNFQGQELTVLEVKSKRAFTSETVGRALGYSDPKNSIGNLHNRYDDELLESIHWDWYDTEKHQVDVSRYSTRIYYQIGVNIIGMHAKTKLAKEFRQWAAETLERVQSEMQADTVPLTSYSVLGTTSFEMRCKICRSEYRSNIDDMISKGVRYQDVVVWAAEHGLSISESGLSRHNKEHRLPHAAPRQVLENPEIGMGILLAKLLDVAQRRALETLSDRDIVKYTHAAASALLTHRISGPKLPPPPEDFN